MSTLTTRPIKTGCNFNAVGNPIVYKFIREDYSFAQINDDSGDAQLQFNSADLTTFFEVDDEIYVEGIGTVVITASAFSGGNTLVTVDYAYSSTSTGYANNLSKRTDYNIQVEVFDADTSEALGPRIITTPGANGEASISISAIVRAYVDANWEQPTTNAPEEGTFKKVYIEYEDFYDDTFWGAVSDSANPIVAVFAVMHVLMNPPPDFTRYAHGGNMLSYFPDDGSRKFLTRFAPSYWRGWPFSMSFIWPEGIGNIERRVKQYDSQGFEISDTNEVLTPDVEKIHRMDLGTIDPDAVELRVTLEESGSDNVDITEEITIKVKEPCPSQLLLFWKNSIGGDAFWMFDESQDYEYTYPSGRVVKRMTLYSDDLTVSEWDGINQMNTMSEVITKNIVDYGMDDSIDKTHFRNDNQVFIINEDGSKTGVIVIPTQSFTKTFQRKHEISVTIELPEFFTV